MTTSTYKSVDISLLDPSGWDIKSGKSAGGILGKVKTNCRNGVNLSVVDKDSDGIENWWDTIDSYNNNEDILPTALPSITGWTSDNLCGKELWSDVTDDYAGDTTCDSPEDECLMKDNVTGLIWSEGDATDGNWDSAISYCDVLSHGGITTWRLPTQIELMEAYNHGIRDVGYKGGTSNSGTDNNQNFIPDVDQNFWSAMTLSNIPTNAWRVFLRNGNANNFGTNNIYRVVCVSP